jgi:hypothetical protein
MSLLTRMGLEFLLVAQLSLGAFAQSGWVISTVAGNGNQGYSGDGGPAASAQLSDPFSIAVDSAGNLFIADMYNQCVRMVTTGGVIRTVAGNGTPGYNGDGGFATSAQLNQPTGVAVDSAGNLFIADNGNDRIRKVTPTGVISTVAGSGVRGYSGDGGFAISAQLSGPYGIAVDSAGNLFIADTFNDRIRKVTTGGVISTVAGGGINGLGDGDLATSAQLFSPYGITVDSAGNLFIADTQNSSVRKVTTDGIINTVAGNGTNGFSGDGGAATSAQLNLPTGMAVDALGNLYIADEANGRIRAVTTNGIINTVAGNGTNGFSGDGGPATSAQLYQPTGIAMNASGNILIADWVNHRIRKLTASSFFDIFFPHVAVGGIWSTSFTLNNTSANTVTGNLILTDSQGNPFTVNSARLGMGSSFPISIPSGGTVFLTVNSQSPNDPQKSGWAKVETSGGSLNGVAAFFQSGAQGAIQNAAGVPSSQPTQFATIPVDENASLKRFTAYGIVNPTNQILVVKLGLVDSNGVLVDDTVSLTLNPGQQIARYLNQDLNRPTFQGSLVFRAQGGGTFVAVALIQNQQLFTPIPVTPGKTPNIPN